MKIIKRALLLFLLISLAFCYLFVRFYKKPEETEIIKQDTQEENVVEENTLWKENKAINDDYVGELVFDSNLVNMSFVCPKGEIEDYTLYVYPGEKVNDYKNGCEGGACNGNDIYLRTDWKTGEYHAGGSLFMDYRNTINDQNIIIYGHNYVKLLDPNRELFFTPLEKLLDEENYEKNRYISIVLEDETRRYEIAYVYIFHLDNDDYDTLQYYRTEYDKDYYGNDDEGYNQRYIDKMEEVKLYDTGVKLEPGDKTLTLQTCVENNQNEIEIVVAKQIAE